MVTSEIAQVTAEGLAMRSGERLTGDMLVMATGLEMHVAPMQRSPSATPTPA